MMNDDIRKEIDRIAETADLQILVRVAVLASLIILAVLIVFVLGDTWSSLGQELGEKMN